jgi:LPS-assembly protein
VRESTIFHAAAVSLALMGIALDPGAARAGPAAQDAEPAWEYCGRRPLRLGPAQLPPQPGEKDPVSIAADNLSYDKTNDILRLDGDIELAQGSRRIRSDALTYDVDEEEVSAKGNVDLAQPGLRARGTEATLNLKTNRGFVRNPSYRFSGPVNARGTAELAELFEDGSSRYRDIVYSTCRPGQRDWDIKAAELEIDQQEGRGVARHARLRVAGIPTLYTPYISFPIDDRRKTGLLVPTIGNSDSSGFELMTPFYLNIAPNMDATLFPRYMSRRGLLLGSEFRVLTRKHSAELYAEGIANDRQYEGGESRSALRLAYRGRFGAHWSASGIFNEVSDDEYLADFGNTLELTSVRNIERRGQLNYLGKGWRARLLLQDFQTIDPAIGPRNRPYARLPQLKLVVKPRRLKAGVELGLDAEYDFFEHNAKVHGHRVAARPYVAWPLRRPFGHLIPRVSFYGATYDLREQGDDEPGAPGYAIPSVNLDGKLIFERDTEWLGRQALQTLEPRLSYLYTPFEDQEDIPVFDSSELTFSFASLFRPNRFSGRDRIGDANQLTLGLTSRTLDRDSGRELFRASVGQILYFRDRDVQIAGPPEVTSSSALVAELSARLLQGLSGRLSLQWDPNEEREQTEKRALSLQYQGGDDRLVNLAYRFDVARSPANSYEDLDLSMRVPVGKQVNLVGRWYYSLLNSQTTEAFAGIEYGRCCWKLRLLGRHLKNRADTNGENSVMVQLELAGLGQFGQDIDKLLERGIYGYYSE